MPVAARKAESSRSLGLPRMSSPNLRRWAPTRIWPRAGSSSRLRQRNRVDLPEPEGPMIATTEPRSTRNETPFKTGSEPKLFHRSAISTIASGTPRSALVRAREPALGVLGRQCQREQDEKIEHRDHRIDLERAIGGRGDDRALIE